MLPSSPVYPSRANVIPTADKRDFPNVGIGRKSVSGNPTYQDLGNGTVIDSRWTDCGKIAPQ